MKIKIKNISNKGDWFQVQYKANKEIYSLEIPVKFYEKTKIEIDSITEISVLFKKIEKAMNNEYQKELKTRK